MPLEEERRREYKIRVIDDFVREDVLDDEKIERFMASSRRAEFASRWNIVVPVTKAARIGYGSLFVMALKSAENVPEPSG